MKEYYQKALKKLTLFFLSNPSILKYYEIKVIIVFLVIYLYIYIHIYAHIYMYTINVIVLYVICICYSIYIVYKCIRIAYIVYVML